MLRRTQADVGKVPGWFCARSSAGSSGHLLAVKCFQTPRSAQVLQGTSKMHILAQPSTSFGKEVLAGAKGNCERPDQFCSVTLLLSLGAGATLKIAL